MKGYWKKDNNVIWAIPFALAIICGLLNPYGGPFGVVTPIFSLLLLYFMQKSIIKEVKRVKTENDADGKEIIRLFTSNWVMVAFAFLMVNIVINIFISYLIKLSITFAENVPLFGGVSQLADKPNICYLLFVGNMLFHSIGTLLIFMQCGKIRKNFAVSLQQQEPAKEIGANGKNVENGEGMQEKIGEEVNPTNKSNALEKDSEGTKTSEK